MDAQEKELYTVRMLGLQLPTDPRWVNLAEMDLQEILTDHAYCEQKATTSCISLIQQYPDRTELVRELAPIVTEEWGHFRMVIKELEKRNLQLGQQRRDEYVNALLKFQNPLRVPRNRNAIKATSKWAAMARIVYLIYGMVTLSVSSDPGR